MWTTEEDGGGHGLLGMFFHNSDGVGSRRGPPPPSHSSAGRRSPSRPAPPACCRGNRGGGGLGCRCVFGLGFLVLFVIYGMVGLVFGRGSFPRSDGASVRLSRASHWFVPHPIPFFVCLFLDGVIGVFSSKKPLFRFV